MRFGVIAWLVACPLVLCVGCFGVTNVDVSDVGAGGATGGASASGSTSSSSGSTSTSAGGMGGAGGGVGGATSSSSSVASSSSAASSSSSGTGGGPGIVCPSVPNTPSMVAIDGTVIDYCIDRTEVTNANYLAWVLTNPQPNTFNEPMECAGNTTLVPSTGNPPDDERPVANVDWCDAYAFCQAHGKRLCGKIGGGPNPWSDWDTTGSQWHKACTANGTLAYPYGNTYIGASCNGADAAITKSWNVGSVVTCEGAYPGLFDMCGNVWEWEDSCETTSTLCHRRGGSFTSNAANVTCGVGGTSDRMNAASNTGFRCCADL